MPWLANGDVGCDTCDASYPGMPSRLETAVRLAASRWGFWEGELRNGTPVTYIACPGCRKNERTHNRIKSTIENETIPGLE